MGHFTLTQAEAPARRVTSFRLPSDRCHLENLERTFPEELRRDNLVDHNAGLRQCGRVLLSRLSWRHGLRILISVHQSGNDFIKIF